MNDYSDPSETSSLNLDLIDADIQRCQDFLSRNELSMQHSNQILQKSNMMSQKNQTAEQKNTLTPSSNRNLTKKFLNNQGNSPALNKTIDKRPISASSINQQTSQSKQSGKSQLNSQRNARPQSAGFSSQALNTKQDPGSALLTQHALSTNDPQFLLRSQNLQQKIQEQYENVPGSTTIQRRQSDMIQKMTPQIQNQRAQDSFQHINDNDQHSDDISFNQIDQNQTTQRFQNGFQPFNQQLTLQPGEKLTDLATNRMTRTKDSKYAFGSRLGQSGEHLARSRPEHVKSRRMLEIEQQLLNQEAKEHTWTPKINHSYNAYHQIQSKYNQIDYNAVMDRRDKMRSEQENNLLREQSFKPHLNNTATLPKDLYQGNKLMSFEERQLIYEEKRGKKLEQIKAEQQKQLQATQQPKTPRQKQIFSRLSQSPFLERQRIYAEQREEKLNMLKKQEENKFAQMLENKQNSPSYSSSTFYNIKGNFDERQKQYAIRKKQKNAQLQEQYDAKIQMEKNKTFASENDIEETYKRLYYCKKKRRHQDELDPQIYTFQPQINEKSKEICLEKPKLQDNAIQLYKEKQERRDQEQYNQEKKNLEQYTFKPQLSELSKAVMPHFRFDDTENLMKQIETEREYKLRKQQDQKRELEMRAVSQNQPRGSNLEEKTKDPYAYKKLAQKDITQIKGMDTVEKKRQLIEKMKQEQLERELKVFGPTSQPYKEPEKDKDGKIKQDQSNTLDKVTRRPPTIVEPFELTKRVERSIKRDKMYVSQDEYNQVHQWPSKYNIETTDRPSMSKSKLLYQSGQTTKSQVAQRNLNTKNLVEAMMRVEL